MLELGNLTEKLHKKIWNSLKNIQNKYVISVGEFARFYQADIHFKDVEKLINSAILSSFSKNSVILIKASHGIHLEKIIKRI
ncbi:MAG TPA: hypothetical protein ENL20_09445 [Candidatus Cloacimonetes bacterium]|nr:hypothetical protein [Candidatus Cloacimonadota bacterium]